MPTRPPTRTLLGTFVAVLTTIMVVVLVIGGLAAAGLLILYAVAINSWGSNK